MDFFIPKRKLRGNKWIRRINRIVKSSSTISSCSESLQQRIPGKVSQQKPNNSSPPVIISIYFKIRKCEYQSQEVVMDFVTLALFLSMLLHVDIKGSLGIHNLSTTLYLALYLILTALLLVWLCGEGFYFFLIFRLGLGDIGNFHLGSPLF